MTRRLARAVWLSWMATACVPALAAGQANGRESEAPLRAQAALPDAPGVEVARANCASCHGAALIVGQRLTRVGWDREVAKMERWSRPVPAQDRDRLLEYLARHFGVTRTPSPADGFTGR